MSEKVIISSAIVVILAIAACLVSIFNGPTTTTTDSRQLHPLVSTSAWCRGSDVHDRRCRFRNLCYRRQSDEFLFVHGPDSDYLGLDDRSGFVARMTSVAELNVHYLTLTDLPARFMDSFQVKFLEGETLLLKRFKPDNIMHAIHDDLLPLYATLRELCFGDNQTCFDHFRIAMMDGLPEGPLSSYYSLMSANVLLVQQLDNDTVYCFEKAFVGINDETTWYNYGFDRPQHPVASPASGKTIRSFADFALNRIGIDRTDCPSESHAVLLSRSHDRLILNEEDVIRVMENVTQRPVVRLDDQSRMDPKLALKMIACADALIGMHGAELILATFAKPGAILFEMYPYAVPAEEYTPYHTLAAIPGVDLVYGHWENSVAGNSRGHPDRPAHRGGLRDLDAREQRRILESQRVAPHLCCEDPEWLYRIYQDTYVDSRSFHDGLAEVSERRKDFVVEDPEVVTYPGKVRNAECRIANSENSYLLTWKAPWNLKYLTEDSDAATYEVWIKKTGEEDSAAEVTRRTSHLIDNPDGTGLDCWIGCRIRKVTGIMQWVRCG